MGIIMCCNNSSNSHIEEYIVCPTCSESILIEDNRHWHSVFCPVCGWSVNKPFPYRKESKPERMRDSKIDSPPKEILIKKPLPLCKVKL